MIKLLKPGIYTLNHAEKAYHALIIGVEYGFQLEIFYTAERQINV